MTGTPPELAVGWLQSRLETLIAVPRSLPVQYDDEEGDAREDETWIRASLLWLPTTHVSSGVNRRTRTRGEFRVSIRSPFDSGSGLALEIAHDVRQNFGVAASGEGPLTLDPVSIENVGRVGAFHATDAVVTFELDELNP